MFTMTVYDCRHVASFQRLNVSTFAAKVPGGDPVEMRISLLSCVHVSAAGQADHQPAYITGARGQGRPVGLRQINAHGSKLGPMAEWTRITSVDKISNVSCVFFFIYFFELIAILSSVDIRVFRFNQ